MSILSIPKKCTIFCFRSCYQSAVLIFFKLGGKVPQGGKLCLTDLQKERSEAQGQVVQFFGYNSKRKLNTTGSSTGSNKFYQTRGYHGNRGKRSHGRRSKVHFKCQELLIVSLTGNFKLGEGVSQGGKCVSQTPVVKAKGQRSMVWESFFHMY